MYRCNAITIANCLSAIFLIACPAAFCLDPKLVGTWTGTMKTSKGPVSAIWSINQHGVYKIHLLNRRDAEADDEGELVADSGRWRRRGVLGNESGTYSLPGTGRLITMGASGMTEWRLIAPAARSYGSAISSSTAPAAIAKPFSSNFSSTDSRASNSPSAFAAFGSYAANQREQNAAQQHVKGAYDPRWNPANFASQTAPQDNGYYEAAPTRAYNPYAQQSSASRPLNASIPIDANLQGLLFNDFPLPKTGDEVQQYALPALGRAALGPKKKRDFRLIY